MTNSPASSSDGFLHLDPRIQRWIWNQKWSDLRDVQERAILPILSARKDIILSAPTSAGKTEAAFLPILTRIVSDPKPSVQALYISPLRALINDQFERLELLCEELDVPVHKWHGDVNQARKQHLLKNPRGIALITPESLEALLMRKTGALGQMLKFLQYLVIDEFHSFIGNERGAQLRSLMHRVDQISGLKVPRIALSATLADLDEVSKFLRPPPNDVERICADGSGTEIKAQIRGVVDDERMEGGEREKIGEIEVARHLFQVLRGSHNLVFANSRSNVELYADLLGELSKKERVPDEFTVHHGSLSREIREFAESRLRERSRPTTCVCTSTLEMGIDIGPMESVAQIGPPPSVAALRQRLGRSGRRGSAATIRMYAIEPALTPTDNLVDSLRFDLVREIAMLELLIEGWIEPPDDRWPHFSTLIQQVLSVVYSRSGASLSYLFSLLCGSGPFASVTQDQFIELSRQLKEKLVIQQAPDGMIYLGPLGERLTSHYSFYAAFMTPEEYRLVSGAKTLGSLPILYPILVNDPLIFAGKRWRVSSVDEEARVITLVPSHGRRPPQFGPGDASIHATVRAKMRSVLEGDTEPHYLDPIALRLLHEARTSYSEAGLFSRQIVGDEANTAIFHWSGDPEANTIRIMLSLAGIEIESTGNVIVAAASKLSVLSVLAQILESEPPNETDLASRVPNKRVNKYDWLLPDSLLDYEYGRRELDSLGAIRAVAQLLQNDQAS